MNVTLVLLIAQKIKCARIFLEDLHACVQTTDLEQIVPRVSRTGWVGSTKKINN